MERPAGVPSGQPAGADVPASPSQAGGTADLVGAAEAAILGSGPRYTRVEVSRMTGVAPARLTGLWRALGFASPESDDEAMFLDADVDAIRGLDEVLGSGFLDRQAESAVVRTMGRTFSRLAEWEVDQLRPLLGREPSAEEIRSTVDAVLPLMRDLQDYVWRRHLASAAGRVVPHGQGDRDADSTGHTTTVGFVDIVGFTRNSRKLSGPELGELVERFEATTNELVASARGRIIKTIGDEVMWSADDPVAAARVALALSRRHAADETFPQVRAGVALGPVLSRLGDVFGETVNIASRLTSLARPGTVLANEALARLLDEVEDLTLRRVPPAHVKGYSRLESWVVRPAEA